MWLVNVISCFFFHIGFGFFVLSCVSLSNGVVKRVIVALCVKIKSTLAKLVYEFGIWGSLFLWLKVKTFTFIFDKDSNSYYGWKAVFAN